jgi:hypothetical protein
MGTLIGYFDLGGFSWIGLILNFVMTIVLALFLVRGLLQTNYPRGTNQPLSARQILELLYLRSEINPKPSKQKGQSKKRIAL